MHRCSDVSEPVTVARFAWFKLLSSHTGISLVQNSSVIDYIFNIIYILITCASFLYLTHIFIIISNLRLVHICAQGIKPITHIISAQLLGYVILQCAGIMHILYAMFSRHRILWAFLMYYKRRRKRPDPQSGLQVSILAQFTLQARS